MKLLITLTGILFLQSCSPQKKMAMEKTSAVSRFDIQGHRGCRGLMPENTIPAMIKAADMGVTTLELDVVITKDKKVLVSHEPWFGQDISTKPDGSYIGDREERKYNIYWMTYEQTKTFDVGMKPHPRFPKQEKMKVTKPLLADLVDSVKYSLRNRRRGLLYYNIEIKSDPAGDGVFHPAIEEFVELVMGVVKEKSLEEACNIQSFDFRSLQYLHKKYPEIRTAMLIDETDKRSFDQQLARLGFTANIYSPHFSLVTPKLISVCHKKGMKIIPWTVNDKAKITELREMGVDGIITDFPDLLLQ